ncbi:uncharacterized protein METZ01_LOCUS340432, partial [marine metagenome]
VIIVATIKLNLTLGIYPWNIETYVLLETFCLLWLVL